MECLTWAAPIVPGQLEQWREFIATMKGPRRAEHEASRRRLGMTREVASLMSTPESDFVCLYHESDDLAKCFQLLAESTEPFDIWFKEQVAEIHGLTPEMLAGPPPATLALDYQA